LERPRSGEEALHENVLLGPPPVARTPIWGDELMVLWPAVSLIGFLVLTALVIALGTRSTARYERERRSAVFEDNTAAEPATAVTA
jgi:hypothetical protein